LTWLDAAENGLVRLPSDARAWYVQVPSISLAPEVNENALVVRLAAPVTSE
jgi:hypothetical protein